MITEQDTERTWKPTAAGILCIIAGITAVMPAMAVMAIIFSNMFYHGGIPPHPLVIPLILLLVSGIMSIVGGIYALRRRRWRLALAGSICCPLSNLTLLVGFVAAVGLMAFPDPAGFTILPILLFIVGFVIFGILPIVFVVQGKGEFKAKALVGYKRGDAYDEAREYDKVT
jgi:hypothetical protein